MARRAPKVEPPPDPGLRLFLSPGGVRTVRARLDTGDRTRLDAMVADQRIRVISSTILE